MKFSDYFRHTRTRPDRKNIEIKWIEAAYTYPDRESVQSDGRVRRWKYISEVDKFLRIVVLEDNETVHNAFFDRSFKN